MPGPGVSILRCLLDDSHCSFRFTLCVLFCFIIFCLCFLAPLTPVLRTGKGLFLKVEHCLIPLYLFLSLPPSINAPPEGGVRQGVQEPLRRGCGLQGVSSQGHPLRHFPIAVPT
ncbi:hypothetical protein BDQ94DRAFT_150359 [Aspergillus welwitschiae]|uniref:Uncharacterized protein n=1 Tax=Aspergillus welwitschiae TaxID=1341132 RepID=A0A3F3PRC1_9EURO|nr:hypothetical protein BDQ94DRAFT_150359 [Aspergillus welwitschiae]RDH29485.1 hypothetical protein BDQ94DRAFT_150359 [Aspergillus welwitschiae]